MGSNRSGGAARKPSTLCTGGAKSHVRPHGESIMSQRGLACVCRPVAGMSCEPATYSGMFGMSTPRDHSARSCGGNSMLWHHNLHARLGRAAAIAGACTHDRQGMVVLGWLPLLLQEQRNVLSQRALSTELARVTAREACVGHAQREQASFHHARRPVADSAEAIAEPHGSKQSATMSRDKLTSAGLVQWKRAMDAWPAGNFAHNV